MTVKWTFNREEMFRTLKRLALVNTEKFKGVVFTPQGDHVTLQSENPDIGDGLEIVSWTEEKAEPPAPAKEAEKEEGGEEEETLLHRNRKRNSPRTSRPLALISGFSWTPWRP